MSNVSILIPVYNRSKFIAKCLDTCVSQTYRDIEIVCYDDGSSDSTPSIISAYQQKDPRIRMVRSSTNNGVANAFNNLLSECKTKYACLLGSDDQCSIYRVERQLGLIEKQNSPIVFSLGTIFRGAIPEGQYKLAPAVVSSVRPYGSAFFEVSKVPKFREVVNFNGEGFPTSVAGSDAVWLSDILKAYFPGKPITNVSRITDLMPCVEEVLYLICMHKDRVSVWKRNRNFNREWYDRMARRIASK